MENTEIEIKLSITESQFLDLQKKMEKEAEFIKKVNQKDTYFSPAQEDYFISKDKCLRIREDKNINKLNYKQIFFGETDLETYIKEIEVSVDDVKKMEDILQCLQIKKVLVVDKKRIEFRYKKNYLVALDNIENLGCYIELEFNGRNTSIAEANRKLYTLAEELNLDISKQNKEGYSNLMYKKIFGDGED